MAMIRAADDRHRACRERTHQLGDIFIGQRTQPSVQSSLRAVRRVDFDVLADAGAFGDDAAALNSLRNAGRSVALGNRASAPC